MADTVQYHLENMIPELEDYQKRNIFSEEEVRKIVQKRREFEYALKRVPVRKVDCMRYIEYELTLDTVRQARYTEATEFSKYDLAIQQRIHMLFNRYLRKFHGDLSLWVQYIDFCKRAKGGNKVLSKVFARCLQIHPREQAIWIEAAKFEFEENGNIDGSRVMLHRALRLNEQSKELWVEYLRLEFLFIRKMMARRQVLGLPEDQALDQDKQAVFQGAIPLVVVQSACEALPKTDLNFRLEILSVADEYPSIPAVADKIVATIAADFPTNALALSTLAQRQEDFPKVIAAFHDAMVQIPTAEMLMYFILWLEQVTPQYPMAVKVLEDVWAQYESILNAPLSLKRIDFVMRRYGIEKAMEQIKKSVEMYPQDQDLHLLSIELQLRSGKLNVEAMDQLFQCSFKALGQESSALLWKRYTEWLLCSFPTLEFVHSKFKTDRAPMNCQRMYLRFCFTFCGIEQARKVYQRWLKRPLLPNDETFDMLKECVTMECCAVEQKKEMCLRLFERLVDLFPTASEVWIQYIEWFEANQEFTKANAIRWRAKQQIGETMLH